MAQLEIKGHETRGSEVIALLEMLGGINSHNLYGDESYAYYTIDSDKEIKGRIYMFGDEDLLSLTLEQFEENFPYKVGDKVKVPYEDGRITGNEIYEYKILKIKWDSFESMIKYGLPSGNEQRIEYYSTDNLNIWNKKEIMEEIKIDIPKGYEFAGVDDDNQQVVFEKIGCQYPKTYKECCKVLGLYTMDNDAQGYEANLIIRFQELLIARDAYWKIAGEQMGLDKPWEPNWKDTSQSKHSIWFNNEGICIKSNRISYAVQHILTFPTSEIRDAFFENFKDLIENCKELL